MAEFDVVRNFNLPGTAQANRQGPTIASATTIAPTHPIHMVSGTTPIVTITVPYEGFSGSIMLIPTAIWTWTAAGNIYVLGTVTTAVGRFPVIFTYLPSEAKWYPSRVS